MAWLWLISWLLSEEQKRHNTPYYITVIQSTMPSPVKNPKLELSELHKGLLVPEATEEEDHDKDDDHVDTIDYQPHLRHPPLPRSSPSSHHQHQHQPSYLQFTFRIIHILRHALLFLANVAAWYTTNGMNGIAMQKAAVALREQAEEEEKVSFFVVLTNTALMTAMQLLLGAVLGRVLLCLYSVVFRRNQPILYNSSNNNNNCKLGIVIGSLQPAQILLAALHMIGSLATNLGFMFGSASLVQIIKLMEPFQTLLLTKLFSSEEGKHITPGIVASMSVTVGAAMSLIQTRPQQPPILSVLFAILSGLTLSSRNVLQRHQYLLPTSSSSLLATGGAGSPYKQQQQQQQQLPVHHHQQDESQQQQQLSQLERALVQFTQLSLQSGLVITCTLVLPLLCAMPSNKLLYLQDGALESHGDVFVWHPLYNAFSMITLAFCSALTHSLLNAGKRVVAIAMAIVWFKEGFTVRNVLGLAVTLLGGCWYTWESKKAKRQPLTTTWMKFIPALFILHFLFSSIWEGIIGS